MQKNYILLIYSLIFSLNLSAQAKIKVHETIENLGFWSGNIVPVGSDKNCSTFLMDIDNDVKPHYHEYHTENVYVVSGSANLRLGDTTFVVNAGDLVVIPPMTIHSVKLRSMETFRIISIQSPEYKGIDQIWVEDH